MGESIGQILAFAVGVALSPIPIIAVVLLLSTPRGGANGSAFLLGWVVGLSLVGGVVLLVAGGSMTTDSGQPSDSSSYLRIALGLLLLFVARRQFKGRPAAGEDPQLPKWMKAVDSFTPTRSAGVAFVLAAINPKNLILTIGAAMAISQTSSGTGAELGTLAIFVLVATMGPGLPVVIYAIMKGRADELLERLRIWMTRENATILTVLCLIIAAKLIGDGISGLSA